jgi:hypothetical protein
MSRAPRHAQCSSGCSHAIQHLDPPRCKRVGTQGESLKIQTLIWQELTPNIDESLKKLEECDESCCHPNGAYF